jgi:hypothetical protein
VGEVRADTLAERRRHPGGVEDEPDHLGLRKETTRAFTNKIAWGMQLQLLGVVDALKDGKLQRQVESMVT